MSQENTRASSPAGAPTAPEHIIHERTNSERNQFALTNNRTTPRTSGTSRARVGQSVEVRTATVHAPRRAPGAPVWRGSGTLGGASTCAAPFPFRTPRATLKDAVRPHPPFCLARAPDHPRRECRYRGEGPRRSPSASGAQKGMTGGREHGWGSRSDA